MSNKYAWVLVFVAVILVGYWFISSKNKIVESPSNISTDQNINVVTNDEKVSIEIVGDNFAFSQNEIRVKEGDTVEVIFTNNEGMHDFVLDEFNARTKVLQAGQTETITFLADQKGTFEYYCSVGSHRAMGMKGSFIVE